MEGRGVTRTYSSLKSSFKITRPLAGFLLLAALLPTQLLFIYCPARRLGALCDSDCWHATLFSAYQHTLSPAHFLSHSV